MPKLNDYLKIKDNPEMALFKVSQEVRYLIPDLIEKEKDKLTDFLNKEIEKIHQSLLEELENKVSKIEQTDPKHSNFIQKIVNQTVTQLVDNSKGDRGEKGEQGDRGEQGQRGEDGYTPQKGQDFFTPNEIEEITSFIQGQIKVSQDGKTPIAGLDYPNEEQNKEVILKEIEKIVADKIVIFKTEIETSAKKLKFNFDEKIKEISQIVDNLRLEITQFKKIPSYEVKRKKGGGGGGMSDPKHESKSVSSSTTTITTNFPIAASGFAIWAYYQGQMIIRGTHYTVGGNLQTLTLLFTPADLTTIDLIYM